MEASAVICACTPLVQPLEDTGAIPNNAKCPLLIYPNALELPNDNPARVIEQVLAANHWGGTWRDSIYAFHHYHSTAHEVLVCYHGSAEIQFGGEPGITYIMNIGDVILIPAGTGHKNLHATDDFAVVGGYPEGQKWDMCYGKAGERPQADQNIARVPFPKADPIYGGNGPVMEFWKA
jgi:uncharacterized protein YjlB